MGMLVSRWCDCHRVLGKVLGCCWASERVPFHCFFETAPWAGGEGNAAGMESGTWAAFPPFQQPAGRSRNPPAIESVEKPFPPAYWYAVLL